MNTKQMKAAMAKVAPKSKTEAVTTSGLQQLAMHMGAVPSATIGFFADIGTSFKYHEAVRKGEL